MKNKIPLFKNCVAFSIILMTVLAISCGSNNQNAVAENEVAENTKTEEKKHLSDEDVIKMNLEYLIYDISQQKPERFHWFTKEDVMEISGGKPENYEEGHLFKFIAEQPEEWIKEIKRVLEITNNDFNKCGFDFSNYTIDSLKDIELNIDESMGYKTKVYRGTAVLNSGGKLFDFEFKNLCLKGNDAKYVDGFDIKDAAAAATDNTQVSHEGTQFSAADMAKANTAAKAAGMTQMDKNVIMLCNLARLDGTKFWNSYVEPNLDGKNNANTTSLKADLAKVKDLPMFQVDASLQKASAFHANDMGVTGGTGHNSSDGTSFANRVRSYYSDYNFAENCSYGCETALEVVLQLLIDKGTPSLGHRKNILNPRLIAIGVTTSKHTKWKTNTVQDFGGSLITPQPLAE